MRITIFGQPGCDNCSRARRILPAAAYYSHDTIFDYYPVDEATLIVTATNGTLPIIVIETEIGRLVLGMGADGHLVNCESGTCRIK
jgi:glutaredoxin